LGRLTCPKSCHEAMHAAHAINGPTFAHVILTTEELLARLERPSDDGLSS
jgi:hypothetical protein